MHTRAARRLADCFRPWLSGKGFELTPKQVGPACAAPIGWAGAAAGPFQAGAVANRCPWSFRRLWVAAASRHSERTADLPRRWKRVKPRLNFI
jgi:hypothetical protein